MKSRPGWASLFAAFCEEACSSANLLTLKTGNYFQQQVGLIRGLHCSVFIEMLLLMPPVIRIA